LALITIAFLYVAFAILTLPGGVEAFEAGLILPTILLAYNLFALYNLSRMHYYITNRRILKKQSILLLRSQDEVPLNLLTVVTAKRSLGTKIVEFHGSGRKKLVFRMLRDDPEHVRLIALQARSKLPLT